MIGAQIARHALTILVASALSACSLFDSGVEWKGGPYALQWIDISENVTLVRMLDGTGSIGRIEATVFAVGWDGRYLVAKQHPGGNKAITNYFIIDSRLDSNMADPDKAVTGPLSQGEFRKRAEQLKLPGFTRTLDSLE